MSYEKKKMFLWTKKKKKKSHLPRNPAANAGLEANNVKKTKE